MDWIQIGFILLLVFILIAYTCFKANLDDLFVIVSVVCVMSMVVLIPMYAESLYSNSYTLPQDYIAANNNVEEIEQLLLRHENRTADNSTMINNIDFALESQELKQTLAKAIVKRNQLKAEINTWLNHPLTPYKGRLLSQLPEDFERS